MGREVEGYGVAELEEQLHARLLHRTTRTLSLTDADTLPDSARVSRIVSLCVAAYDFLRFREPQTLGSLVKTSFQTRPTKNQGFTSIGHSSSLL